MAIVTVTNFYSAPNRFPPDLLRTEAGVTITAQTATTFAWQFNAGTDFAGDTIGTGFPNDSTALTIKDASGHLVMSVTGIAAGSLASDLSQFATHEFGFATGGGWVTGASIRNASSALFSGSDTFDGIDGPNAQVVWGLNAGDDMFRQKGGDNWVNGGLLNDTMLAGRTAMSSPMVRSGGSPARRLGRRDELGAGERHASHSDTRLQRHHACSVPGCRWHGQRRGGGDCYADRGDRLDHGQHPDLLTP